MKKITVFAYGEIKESPGPATINIHVVDEKDAVIIEYSESIGNAARNYADYYAVMSALQTIKEKFGEETRAMTVECKLTDEELVKQLNAECEMNNPGLVPLFIEIHNLRVSSFPHVSFVHVPDSLALGK